MDALEPATDRETNTQKPRVLFRLTNGAKDSSWKYFSALVVWHPLLTVFLWSVSPFSLPKHAVQTSAMSSKKPSNHKKNRNKGK
jgi:hypothetical protein